MWASSRILTVHDFSFITRTDSTTQTRACRVFLRVTAIFRCYDNLLPSSAALNETQLFLCQQTSVDVRTQTKAD